MIVNYLKVAWRNTVNNPVFSFINVAGLATGMAVVILIGMWIHDELSFNKNHSNYDRLARVIVNHTFNGEVSSQWAQPFPLGEELRNKYSEDLEQVTMTSWSYGHFLQHDEKKLSAEGMFVGPPFIKMFSLNMMEGNEQSLNDLHSIILSTSLAKTIFGDVSPIGQMIKIDDYITVMVTGVYEDLPRNSAFSSSRYLLPWDLYAAENEWVKNSQDNWGNYSFPVLVQLRPNADLAAVSKKIADVILLNKPQNDSHPTLLLHPMSKWHLYADFENGVNTGGDVQFVWLFGVIGSFVLLLACINFMNLSTARSEKRAKEVGLRKAIGSGRSHLVKQFLSESLLFSMGAFVLSLVFVQLSLNLFNQLAGKKMEMELDSPLFWVFGLAFTLFTGLLAGSYPALYLSSLKPIKVLKGTFKAGRASGMLRRFLVVTQFTVSMTLIIGTAIVYRQIMHAKDRPIGYDRNSLITTYGYPFSDHSNRPMTYDALHSELMQTRAVMGMGKSSSPTTGAYSNQTDFDWEGKDPSLIPNFAVVWCSQDYGKTIGTQFIKGRDFSRDHASDTAAIILNEAAVEFIGFDDPVGRTIRYNMERDLEVIGVVENVLMESPYEPVRPTVYMVSHDRAQILTLKLNPDMSAQEALGKVEPVFKKFRPAILFEYQFVDDAFKQKFANEERIGKLASAFAGLAIFISCLGIFGLASFMAEQRTKEIGIRKILGASMFRLWKLLSSDFIFLIAISCVLAIPVSYYFLDEWLQRFTYRTEISWWIFGAATICVLLITLITVSFQSIKAALANPVDSLRNE